MWGHCLQVDCFLYLIVFPMGAVVRTGASPVPPRGYEPERNSEILKSVVSGEQRKELMGLYAFNLLLVVNRNRGTYVSQDVIKPGRVILFHHSRYFVLIFVVKPSLHAALYAVVTLSLDTDKRCKLPSP